MLQVKDVNMIPCLYNKQLKQGLGFWVQRDFGLPHRYSCISDHHWVKLFWIISKDGEKNDSK